MERHRNAQDTQRAPVSYYLLTPVSCERADGLFRCCHAQRASVLPVVSAGQDGVVKVRLIICPEIHSRLRVT